MPRLKHAERHSRQEAPVEVDEITVPRESTVDTARLDEVEALIDETLTDEAEQEAKLEVLLNGIDGMFAEIDAAELVNDFVQKNGQ